MDRITKTALDNAKLIEIAKDYQCARGALGEEKMGSIVTKAKAEKWPLRHSKSRKGLGDTNYCINNLHVRSINFQ